LQITTTKKENKDEEKKRKGKDRKCTLESMLSKILRCFLHVDNCSKRLDSIQIRDLIWTQEFVGHN
jgi:hypothetical protein